MWLEPAKVPSPDGPAARLADAVQRLAGATTDPDVREWLEGLLRGERAEGTICPAADATASEQAPQPPQPGDQVQAEDNAA